MVDQKAVRDRFGKVQKDLKRKRAYEERASGICPDEPDELDQALENISEMDESQQEQLKVGEAKKKAEGQKECETADLIVSFCMRTQRGWEPQQDLELALPECGSVHNKFAFPIEDHNFEVALNQTKEMDDFLYMLHDHGNIDDEELLLLMPIYRRDLHVGLPYSLYYHFSIFDMRDDECEVEFHFKKEDIFRLAAALQLPDKFKCQNSLSYRESKYAFKKICVSLQVC